MYHDSLGNRPIIFRKGNLSIAEVADALSFDKQTVRTLIQTGSVSWGKAVKKPGSSHFMYLISPKKFYEATGVLIGAEIDEYQIWDDLQGKYSTDTEFFRYAENRKQAADEAADLKRRAADGI